jgi:chloride channel protein, CIC family
MPGGLFAPSLFIGAVAGGAFGKLLQMLFPGMVSSPGAYALVGMGAFLAAATHAPMTAIFLLFEMTASYEVIIPIMLACVIGTAICRRLQGRQPGDRRAGPGRHRSGGGQGAQHHEVAAGRRGDGARSPGDPENMTLRQFTRFIATPVTPISPGQPRGELTGILSVQDFLGVVFEKDLMDLVVVKELATLDVITVHEDDDLDPPCARSATATSNGCRWWIGIPAASCWASSVVATWCRPTTGP